MRTFIGQLYVGTRRINAFNVERPGNDHTALSQAGLHARRYVHDFRLFFDAEVFPATESCC
jgi:hypothetical protein